MTESNLRNRVIRVLQRFDAHAIENTCEFGTPDVECSTAWIELKVRPEWPKREDTVVRFDHFTAPQRKWLRDRWRCNGRAWLLAVIDRDFLLFSGGPAGEYFGRVARRKLEALATAVWKSSEFDEGFPRIIANPCEKWVLQ